MFGGTSVFVVICSFRHSKPENLQIYHSYVFFISQFCNTKVILEDERDWFKMFWIPCSSCSSPLPENSASLAGLEMQKVADPADKYCNIYYLLVAAPHPTPHFQRTRPLWAGLPDNCLEYFTCLPPSLFCWWANTLSLNIAIYIINPSCCERLQQEGQIKSTI